MLSLRQWPLPQHFPTFPDGTDLAIDPFLRHLQQQSLFLEAVLLSSLSKS